jgi:hypothetical protein
VILTVVLLGNIGSDSARSLGRVVPEKRVVSTLDEERVKLGNLLTTNPELESGGVRGIRGEETIGVCSHIGNKSILNPNVTEKVTLRTNGYGNLIRGTEGTNVVHALRLHREVSVTLVVLSEKTDLWLTSDEHILGTFRNKINQSS